MMPDPGALPPHTADEAAGRRRALSTTGAAGQRAAGPVPADPQTGYLLNRYQHAQVIMVAPVAGGVALVAVLNAAQLGIWAALAVSLAVAIAALMYLRARHWTQTIIRHLQNPPAPQICLGQVCARPSSLGSARAGQRYLDLLALTPSLHPGTRILARVPLIAGQHLPAVWQQGDPVTVLGRPRPGRVIIAVAAGNVLLPAGRARWPVRRYALTTTRR